MELSVKIMKKSDTIKSILQFQTDTTSEYWRKKLFIAYPFLNETYCFQSDYTKRQKYLKTELSAFYDKIKHELRKKINFFEHKWSENKEIISSVYSQVFNLDCNLLLNDMIAEISLNPICPRNLKKHSFTVYYGGDENIFIKTALHEIIHFMWFYVWQRHFKDNIEEYNNPNLKWILSEMVIDTLVKNTNINKLFPQAYQQYPAYKYFYEMTINNRIILDDLAEMYKVSPRITQFMEKAYKYCQDNENDIRKQIP